MALCLRVTALQVAQPFIRIYHSGQEHPHQAAEGALVGDELAGFR